ncbi:mitochondrial carrier protein-like protein [Alternaria alternata]|nr:mitochondrial carrier protein-like protein [Alternaria alternata]
MSGNTNSDILIAGAIAAFTVDLLVYPLDTIKTRIQSPQYAKLYTDSRTGKVDPKLFRGVYQGIGSVIIATLPSSGAFFTTYERTKSLFTTWNTNTKVIKQNAQMVSSSNPTNATLDTLRRFRSNPLALWRGYTALAGRNLPFTAMQFPLFERLKGGIKEYRDEKGLTRGGVVEMGVITAVSAGSAGAVSAVITTPIDVVKTRVMLAAGEGGSGSGPSKDAQSGGGGAGGGKAGLVDALGNSSKDTVKKVADSVKGRKSSWAIGKEIVEEKGFRGLWRGGALRGVWTFIGAGLYLGAYESGRVWLAGRRGEKVDEDELF